MARSVSAHHGGGSNARHKIHLREETLLVTICVPWAPTSGRFCGTAHAPKPQIGHTPHPPAANTQHIDIPLCFLEEHTAL